MILGKATAVFMTEILYQYLCETDEQVVSFVKAKLAVIIFHAVQVKEQQGRVFVLLRQTQSAGFRQLEEITHIWEPGKLVKIIFPEKGSFMQCLGKRLVQPVIKKASAF